MIQGKTCVWREEKWRNETGWENKAQRRGRTDQILAVVSVDAGGSSIQWSQNSYAMFAAFKKNPFKRVPSRTHKVKNPDNSEAAAKRNKN